jgi:hypothetical protein
MRACAGACRFASLCTKRTSFGLVGVWLPVCPCLPLMSALTLRKLVVLPCRGRRRAEQSHKKPQKSVTNQLSKNIWRTECCRGAQRRAWKRSGRCRAFLQSVSTCENLVWLPRANRLHCRPLRNQLFTAPAPEHLCAPVPCRRNSG